MHRFSDQTCVYIVKTRPLLLILISRGILVCVYVQLLMVLRMLLLVHSDWYHASKVHLLYLSIIWQNCLLHFLSNHMCKLQSKLLAHMQGEQLLPYGIHETCPYLFTRGKYAWEAIWIQLNFNSYLYVRVVINYQKGGD